jgi:hypothetical protein
LNYLTNLLRSSDTKFNSTQHILNNGDEVDNGSVEDVEPANLLGNRKKNQNSLTGMIPKGQPDCLLGNGA